MSLVDYKSSLALVLEFSSVVVRFILVATLLIVLPFNWKTKLIIDSPPIGHDFGEDSNDFGNTDLLLNVPVRLYKASVGIWKGRLPPLKLVVSSCKDGDETAMLSSLPD
ncbi:hypothetical protein L1049_005357 [Liquidambar formosana]|uniref:Uncharacterized protein n=1 Tax=Liquidambar formosana TaxID=63359 RepID=A0AAP0RV09_LIQFO